MKQISKTLLYALLPCLFFIIPSLLNAQPGFGGGEDVVDTPIDGGLSLLIASGIGYAAKKLNDKRK